MTAVGLALGAACAWGVADFLAGMASRRVPVPWVLLFVELGGFVVIAGVLLATGEEPPGGRAFALAVVAGLAGVTALGLFYQALAVGTMSVVAPISATGVAIPVVVGIATGDALSTVTAVGLVAAVAGILLASREGGEAAAERTGNRTGVLLALGAALGFGAYFTCIDPAVEESVVWALVVSRGVSCLPVLVLAVVRFAPRRPDGRTTLAICAIGTIDLLATALLGLANNEGAVSVVSVLGALYPVVTVLLAAAVLRERLRPDQAVGVALALAGVGMVAAG